MLKNICSENVSKEKKQFYCEKCDYSCDKLFLYKQHCSTKKHQNGKCSKMLKKYAQIYKCECGKEYKHIQSFNRHEKTCVFKNSDKEKQELRTMISTLVSQNQNMLLENQEMRELVKDMIPKIGNTTINNKFNLNLFLNEECKDAINLTDFITNLKLELNDLDNTRQNGYITGISNIFVRELKQLDLHKRPIHCSDIKREILYVKDNNIWEKDNDENTIMKGAINSLAKRQIDKIKEWELANPSWNKTEEGTNNYIKMVKSITECNDEKVDNKIIKSIAKEVIIDK